MHTNKTDKHEEILMHVYRVAVANTTIPPLAICSAELQGCKDAVSKAWYVADLGVAQCGALVSMDRTFGGLVQVDPINGVEFRDFRTLRLFSASTSDLAAAGWMEKHRHSWASFVAPAPDTVAFAGGDSLYQDPITGLCAWDVANFSALWSFEQVVYMSIQCTDTGAASSGVRQEPHLTLVREVMDACVNGVLGSAVIMGELLSRVFVDTGAASLTCDLSTVPDCIRAFVHECVSGVERTSEADDIDAIREAKQALQAMRE
jgi:hypothetical protein